MDEAKTIAKILVEEKRAACVSIIPHLTSIYSWQGEIVEDSEVQMVIKTTSLDKVENRIKELHSYEVPELVVLEVSHGSSDYLKWLEESIN